MNKLNISPRAKIALVYRPETKSAIDAAKKIIQWLRKNKYNPQTAPNQKPLVGAPLMKSIKEFDFVELVIVLGGDGTYLRANRMLEGRPLPMLGVNLGSLGFLTPLRLEHLIQVLPLVLSGDYGELTPRSQILVELLKFNKIKDRWQSLNDVVIERGPSSHLIDLSLSMDQTQVSSLKADALVLATPTGSTAYNLAAGGPIVHPDTHCFIATAVASHSLTNRPLIFPDTKSIYIQLQGQCKIAQLVIDGQLCAKLTPENVIRISKHTQPHWMVQSVGYNFYELMREKLSFGERN